MRFFVMNRKIFRLGWVLITEGIITRQQLEQALDAQQISPSKTIGEILNYLFGIPEYEIETVFIREVLAQTIVDWFYSEIAHKMKNQDKDINALIPEIKVLIRSYERVSSFTSNFSLKKDMYQPTGSSNCLKKIICDIDHITITTYSNKEIIFKDLEIEYNVQSKKITLDNTSILSEAKLKLTQIIHGKKD